MSQPQTLIDKLWAAHEIVCREDGQSLLWVDRHYVHEGSFHAFGKLAERGVAVAVPGLTFGVADHYVPTRGSRRDIANPELARMVRQVEENTAKHGVKLFGLDDPRQGIVHVVGPEQGLTLPGLLIVCGDSHTSTHGALGAYAFGIGASEVAHVLMTQTIWQKKPPRMRITVDGAATPGVAAKDIVLAIIAHIGADGATRHAIEFAGSAIRALSIEGRLTLCNMSIEAGARCGMIAPDEKTFAYLRGRPYVPKGAAFDRAAEEWSSLTTDCDAQFDRDVTLDAKDIAPTVTWGTSPEDVASITGFVPRVEDADNEQQRAKIERALAYMGLKGGERIKDIEIDRVFIGSCTNGRIEDLRAVAKIVDGRTVHAHVAAMVVPGSGLVKMQAEAEGLDAIFKAAGFEWREPGCSMCLAMNADKLRPGERCASTSNRNFEGRQGHKGRTHLVSPQMAAAAAIAGRFVDIREHQLALA